MNDLQAQTIWHTRVFFFYKEKYNWYWWLRFCLLTFRSLTSNLLDNKIGSEVYICGLFPHIMTMVFLVYFSHAATVSEGLIILYSSYKRLKKRCTSGCVLECWSCDYEVAGLNLTQVCCVPTSSQRAILLGLINEYQQKLWSKWVCHGMH